MAARWFPPEANGNGNQNSVVRRIPEPLGDVFFFETSRENKNTISRFDCLKINLGIGG
jgi:hypothetical protein